MGLSFGKILLLVLLGAAVWLGIMIYRRSQRQRELAEKQPSRAVGAVETVQCAICGTFRPAGGIKACGRNDCPVA